MAVRAHSWHRCGARWRCDGGNDMAAARVRALDTDDPTALGPYRLIGRLASGGMGRIYLARDDQRGGRGLVAVKTLLAEGHVSDIDRRRFAREVKLAQRIDSAYTARVRDSDPDAERPWMAIDYIAAPSLAELTRTCGVLPASAVRWIAAGTAEALVTLHREGIVHRDVKPQNVLLPLDGPRVIDFGISHADDLTRTSLTLGTIAFTSPEQARGEASTAASDVYSLGATLFLLATGRPPYTADGDTLRLLARVQRGELDLGGLPKELVPTIRPCLATDPAERPAPAELLARFRKDQAGMPTTRGGNRWLPPRWTALIGEYAAQGRELTRANRIDPDALTVDQRTSVIPPPNPTRMYTAERERERAAKEHERAERERAEKHAQRERARKERAERERAEKEKAEKARAEKARAEKARNARRARATSSASGSTPSSSSTRSEPKPEPAPTPTPAAKKSSNDAWILIPLAILVLFFWRPWETDTTSTSTTGSSYGSSASRSWTPTPTPTPTADATDRAFRYVRSGQCLNAYDDGHGNWNSTVPVPVDCDSANAYVHVTRASSTGGTSDPCPSGNGRGRWYHAANDDMNTTLCLSRQFRKGQCFPADLDGNGNADLLVVWSCNSDKVPVAGQSIAQITGYYRAPKSYRGQICPANGGQRYWYWKVDGGKNIVCVSPA
ncbi:protein kinase [Streptomyces sp. NPDC014685]|uniref:protein kinase domain-containing protein n=1 Tax=Streptomyces sp. NPDC014685 TaxID=3364881 RepID=UPI0036F788A4